MRKDFLTVFAVLLAVSTFAVAQQPNVRDQQKQDAGNTGVISRVPPKTGKEDANTRTIEGLVSDTAKNPVSGAVVQLKDAKTLQIRSFITQANGTFHFAGLRMDTDYEVSAKAGDKISATKRVSSFESRKLVTVNLPLDKTEKK